VTIAIQILRLPVSHTLSFVFARMRECLGARSSHSYRWSLPRIKFLDTYGVGAPPVFAMMPESLGLRPLVCLAFQHDVKLAG